MCAILVLLIPVYHFLTRMSWAWTLPGMIPIFAPICLLLLLLVMVVVAVVLLLILFDLLYLLSDVADMTLKSNGYLFFQLQCLRQRREKNSPAAVAIG